ncbi:methyl-accepting chemotaxis protein [Maridesulfovibrio sp. FT414]|uniref:methyl-accepting chemotaxis protein n=1 Tax=Maridesulfovibrio sp. FT414 TaxID=2979469 RepID=UPI003D802D7D
MKNLAIAIKLAVGFGAVIILLLVSGGAAYYSLSRGYDSFTIYRGLARDTNLMGRVQANLLKSRIDVKNYLANDRTEDKQKFEENMSVTQELMLEARKEIQNPERAANVAEADQFIVQYRHKFGEVTTVQAEINTLVGIMDDAGPSIEKKLTEIMRTAHDDDHTAAAYFAGQALRNILLARLYASKFLSKNQMTAAERVRSEFGSFVQEINVLDRELNTLAERELVHDLVRLGKVYSEAFGKVVELINSRNAVIRDGLDKLGPAIADNLEAVKLSVKKDQDALGPKVQKQSEEAKSMIGILVLVASILGVLAALYIARGVSSPLAQATKFAEAVSSGDFSRNIDVGRRDEVGKICTALVAIRDSVSAAAAEVEGIVSGVEHGDMNARGDESAFFGGFAKLVNGVNTLVSVYSGFIDKLPVGVMSLTPKFKPVYMNEVAMKVGGIDAIRNQNCYDVFNTEDCRTEDCASDKCMKTYSVEHSSTVARTAAGEFHINYSSVPLIDRSGQVVGVAEIVIDQTEIVMAQNTMMEVAGKANDIADRVASASEELSAQIEEVSNGSEIQQQRVGETAAAMEQMNSSVLEIARNASDARQQSDNATEKAGEGAELVNRVVSAINRVNDVALDLQKDMEHLGEQAKAIGGVMNMITDIADQTNLLALNAAIEAARAGDAGRGFAVVADEVRKLAEKTMAATTEVGNNIKGIQLATDKNLSNVNTAVGHVSEATELANNSGNVLKQIVSMARGASGLVEGIATAAEQQSATSEQINRAVDEVNRIVTETTDGMVQSAAAIQELAEMALELKSVLNSLTARKA